jgi:hypothetical protein
MLITAGKLPTLRAAVLSAERRIALARVAFDPRLFLPAK